MDPQMQKLDKSCSMQGEAHELQFGGCQQEIFAEVEANHEEFRSEGDDQR